MFTRESSVQLSTNFMCEHRFCSQTKTRGDRNCTACFSLANIFNQSTNKSFLAPNYNPTEQVVSHRSVLVI